MDYKRITIIVLILLAVTVISLITTFILRLSIFKSIREKNDKSVS